MGACARACVRTCVFLACFAQTLPSASNTRLVGREKRRGAVGEGGNREGGRWAREGKEKGGGGRGRE